jgi:hypothetical protein
MIYIYVYIYIYLVIPVVEAHLCDVTYMNSQSFTASFTAYNLTAESRVVLDAEMGGGL